MCFEFFYVAFIFPEMFAEFGLDQSRRDSIDAHTVSPEFRCPTASHHNQGGLRRAVKQASWLWPQTGNRSNIDHRAAALSLNHLRDNQADQPQGRDYINLEHLGEHFVGHIQSRSLTDVGCAVID